MICRSSFPPAERIPSRAAITEFSNTVVDLDE
jgi:hypothetical protein